jgi:hypothetical protein
MLRKAHDREKDKVEDSKIDGLETSSFPLDQNIDVEIISVRC